MSSGEHSPRMPQQPWLLRIGLVVSGVAALVGLAYMIRAAMVMVRSGRGLESYRTFWLVEFNWVGFLVFMGCLVGALLIGLVLRWRELRRERQQWSQLENNHGGGDGCA